MGYLTVPSSAEDEFPIPPTHHQHRQMRVVDVGAGADGLVICLRRDDGTYSWFIIGTTDTDPPEEP